MVSCRLRATFLSNYRELQAGGNASILTTTAINYTTGYSQLIFNRNEYIRKSTRKAKEQPKK
jgi:hypothetical protein